MKRLIALLSAVALCLMLGGCSLATRYGDGVPDVLGVKIITMPDNSMEPTFDVGETITCREVDPAELEKGDIIAFWTVIDGERTALAHRICEIYNGGGYLMFQTKGDNAPQADALTVHESEIIGKCLW